VQQAHISASTLTERKNIWQSRIDHISTNLDECKAHNVQLIAEIESLREKQMELARRETNSQVSTPDMEWESWESRNLQVQLANWTQFHSEREEKLLKRERAIDKKIADLKQITSKNP